MKTLSIGIILYCTLNACKSKIPIIEEDNQTSDTGVEIDTGTTLDTGIDTDTSTTDTDTDTEPETIVCPPSTKVRLKK